MSNFSGPWSGYGGAIINTWPADQSGNGLDAVNVAGTTDIVTVSGVPLNLGSSHYLKVANNAAFDQLAAVTVVANIRRYPGSTGEVVSLAAGPTWVPPYGRLRLYFGTALSGVIDDQANVITGTGPGVDGQWHQIALTWDASDGNAYLYHNGVQVGTGNIPISNITSTSQDLNIGDIGITPFQLEAELGDIGLFSERKTVTWLSNLWATGGGTNPPRLADADDLNNAIILLRGNGG